MQRAIPYFSPLISKLQEIKNIPSLSDSDIMNQVSRCVEDLLKNKEWLSDRFYEVDPVHGFNGYRIHEEPDHSMAIFVTSWLPGRGSPIHNHGTWSVSASVVGVEKHTFWEPSDDELAPLKQIGSVDCTAGKILHLERDAIHSVLNTGDMTAVTLQVYGMHPHFTDRVQFDPVTFQTSHFIGKEIAE